MSIFLHPDGHQALISDGPEYVGWSLDAEPHELTRASGHAVRDTDEDGFQIVFATADRVTPEGLVAGRLLKVRPETKTGKGAGLPRLEKRFWVEYRRWGDWAVVDRWMPEDVSRFQDIAFSPDGRWLAGAEAGTVFLVDRASLKTVAQVDRGDLSSGLCFDPSSRYLTALSLQDPDGFVHLWSVADGRLDPVHDPFTGTGTYEEDDGRWDIGPLGASHGMTAFDASGTRLALYSAVDGGAGWGRMHVLDVATGVALWTAWVEPETTGLDGESGAVLSDVAFSPDGRYVYCGTRVGHVVAWDAESGAVAATLSTGGRWAASFQVSGDTLWVEVDQRPVAVPVDAAAWRQGG